MSLYSDLNEVLTPYAQRINGLVTANDEIKADLGAVTSDDENLFWFSNTIPRTYGGIDIDFNDDGSIVLNGTANTTVSYALFGGVHQVDSILPAGKYVFGREFISGTATKNPYFCKTDGTSFLLGQEYTFTEDTAVIIRIGTSNYTFTNATYKFSVRKVGITAKDSVARSKLQPKTIKILGIGNSYTRDCFRWLSKILVDAGYDKVVVGQAYIGSITLAEQYTNLNTANFTYYKYVNTSNLYERANVTLDSVIKDETWDIVIFQQQSDESGQYASFVSNDFDINDFISYVKTAISNDSLKVGLVLPWSHATGYDGKKFEEYYNSDPTMQFTAIKTVIPQVASYMSQCDFIVNVGDAVDYGRENAYLSALGVEMLRTDKNHLQYGIPSYMAGLVYAMTICGINGTESTWYPTSADEGVECVTSANLARLARICAKNAVLAVN